MDRDLLFDFYSFDMEKVNIVFHVFKKLMKDKVPKLFKIFQETKLSYTVFLFEWVIAVFSNILPMDLASRIWDSYFLYGDSFILKIGIAICICLEERA